MSLRFAILGFLSVRPLTGYELKQTFDRSVRHFWSADQAGIYRALGELARDGFVQFERVAQATRPDRKVYEITESGVTALVAWLAEPPETPARREPLLVKLFFASRLNAASFRDLLQAELTAVESELAAFADYAAVMSARFDTLDVSAQSALLGPAITLTNGALLGVAYRSWLVGLLARHDDVSLSVTALLDDVRNALGNA
ncbi:MAG: PadR family transcriptional regulator [Gemmatimonadaceae bacterium]|nr:PadR family transcriptional regulator [Gemmatimonadaceae bacterium]